MTNCSAAWVQNLSSVLHINSHLRQHCICIKYDNFIAVRKCAGTLRCDWLRPMHKCIVTIGSCMLISADCKHEYWRNPDRIDIKWKRVNEQWLGWDSVHLNAEGTQCWPLLPRTKSQKLRTWLERYSGWKHKVINTKTKLNELAPCMTWGRPRSTHAAMIDMLPAASVATRPGYKFRLKQSNSSYNQA